MTSFGSVSPVQSSYAVCLKTMLENLKFLTCTSNTEVARKYQCPYHS